MTDRRPIASRNTGWAKRLTAKLAQTKITPNQISMASMIAAALAGLAFYFGASMPGFSGFLLLILAALFCQLRLICNLLDGMVAVEAGKSAPDGVFWNEAPDRVSDVLILVGLGTGLGVPALGWAAAAAALTTAYIRELGRATTGENDFCGPMAKPQRMALITLAVVIAILQPLWGGSFEILRIALWIVAIGALATALRRSVRLITRLQKM